MIVSTEPLTNSATELKIFISKPASFVVYDASGVHWYTTNNEHVTQEEFTWEFGGKTEGAILRIRVSDDTNFSKRYELKFVNDSWTITEI